MDGRDDIIVIYLRDKATFIGLIALNGPFVDSYLKRLFKYRSKR